MDAQRETAGRRNATHWPALALAALLAAPAPLAPRAAAQDGAAPAAAEPAERAPAAAQEPEPLMPWQRSLEDALAVQARTGQPLLVCVNMDGEPASESLARRRYRDPDFVALAEGFVCVLASPDTHQTPPRDDRGRRIPCPRFGRLVDAEHVDIEPQLYEAYFSEHRVAPRHVGVGPGGEVLFDLYLLQDLSRIDDALRVHGLAGGPRVDPATLSEEALLARPDAACRDELEARFVAGEAQARARLVARALSAERGVQHPELLRLGLRDPVPSVRRAAVEALAARPALAPLELVPAAYAACGAESALRGRLVAAVSAASEAADDEQRRQDAQFHVRALRAVETPSEHVDVAHWQVALAATPSAAGPAPDGAEFDELVDLLERIQRRLDDEPEDAELWIALAAARVRLGRVQALLGRDPTFVFQDAMVACDAALRLVPEEGRALGWRAWASYMSNEPAAAGDAAQRALPGLLAQAGTPLAADVLRILASVRTQAVYGAIAAGEAWPEGAARDALAAGAALLAHEGGTVQDAIARLDLLGTLLAFGPQAAALRESLARFPLSGELHNYLRFQVLRDAGAEALEASYDEPPLSRARGESAASVVWFHGLASFVAAEHLVRCRDGARALATYERGVERFERSLELEAGFEGSARHYQCLALAGVARLHAAAGREEAAVDALVRAVEAAPGSVETEDGLGETPARTARDLRRDLRRTGEVELAAELAERLAAAGLDLGGR